MPLPPAELDQVYGVVCGDLKDRHTATDRLYGDAGLEIEAIGTAIGHRDQPLSTALPRLTG